MNQPSHSFCHVYKTILTNPLMYKEKQFMIDLSKFQRCSEYFYRNYNNYSNGTIIHLEDDSKEPDYPAFQIFIDFCHGLTINITENNVIQLCYFSDIYEVESLQHETTDFINQNLEKLALKLIKYNPNGSFLTEIKIIANNLIYYIQNDEQELISLPISTLDIIIKMFSDQNGKEKDNEIVINFLIECLNKKGRSASVLFMHIDFGNKYSKYLALLSEKDFDFSFLNNKKICEKFFEQSNEIEKLKAKIKAMKNVIKSHIGKIGHDGSWGNYTTITLQLQLDVTVDGIIANQPISCKKYVPGASNGWQWIQSNDDDVKEGSETIRALQAKVGAEITGIFDYNCAVSVQQWLCQNGFNVGIDGIFGSTSTSMLQKAINQNKFA